MALIAYRQFRGEIPRTEPHLLPAGAAQEAHNCVFTAGVLQSTRDGLYLKDMQANPVKGLYTEDGLNFYSWPTETRAFRSPIKEDVHNRMYFLSAEDGIFKVTSRLNMTPNGITPLAANCFRVGVPTPTQAPELTLVERNSIPEHPNARVEIYVFWEDAGMRFGRTQVTTFTEVSKFRHYQVTEPARPSGVPEEAFIRFQMVLMDGNSILARTTMELDETVLSNAFPGTQEYTLTKTGTRYDLKVVWGVHSTVSYQFTLLNEWQEESGPSPAAIVRPSYLQDVLIKPSLPSTTGYKPVTGHRFYRTYGATATFIQVDVTDKNDGTYLDESRDAATQGLALATADYEPPPAGLSGVELSPDGVFAFFTGNHLYLSEPYRPHAASYIYTFSHAIRAVKAGQQAFVVTTADGLYLLAGASPGAMQSIKLPQPQPGIAQRSIVDVDGGAIYASGDGLVVVNGTQTSMDLSQQLFGREKWRQMYGDMLRDASMRLSFHDGHLVASSDTKDAGFVLRLDETVASLAHHTQRMDCTFALPVDDALYYSVGRKLYQFQAGQELPFYWRGREEIFAQAEVFGAGYLRATGPVKLMLWCDGELVYEQQIQPGHFRLPAAMPRCLRLSVGLQGTGKVQELCLARSMTELRHG